VSVTRCDHPRVEWVLSTKAGRLLRRNPTGVFADGRRHPLAQATGRVKSATTSFTAPAY